MKNKRGHGIGGGVTVRDKHVTHPIKGHFELPFLVINAIPRTITAWSTGFTGASVRTPFATQELGLRPHNFSDGTCSVTVEGNIR